MYVIEKQHSVDYEKLVKIVLKFSLEKNLDTKGVGKETVKDLFKVGFNRERRKVNKICCL